jgi:hypothetical protein
MNNSIISLCIFLDSDSNIYLVKSSKKDKKFPLSTSPNVGCKLDDFPISGESKSQLIDLIYDTVNYSMIQREINLDSMTYSVVSVLLSSISKNIKLSNNEMGIYPDTSTVLMYFIDISDYKRNLVKEVVSTIKNFDFSFLDILKFVGLKNIIIYLLLVQTFNFFITDRFVEFVEEKIGDSIIEFLTQ